MLQLLYKYLILCKRVSVPGIGVFYIDRHPASLDFANKELASPTLKIAFSHVFATTEKSFYTFVANQRRVEEDEASKYVADFTNMLKQSLATNRRLHLPGIGLLTQTEAGELHFESTQSLTEYFPKVVAERIVRPEVEHEILVGDESRTNTEMKEFLSDETIEDVQKDYWWIYALILTAIAIGAIIYYYSLHGTLR